MRGSKQLLASKPLSDALLDGLFGGLAGGVAMALYLIIWGWLAGRAAGNVLGLFNGSTLGAPLTGGLTHLAVSAVYGLLFGLVWRALGDRIPSWMTGVVYGLVLVTTAEVALLPMSGSPLAQIPTLHFALAHAIYGVVLGLVSERIAARES